MNPLIVLAAIRLLSTVLERFNDPDRDKTLDEECEIVEAEAPDEVKPILHAVRYAPRID